MTAFKSSLSEDVTYQRNYGWRNAECPISNAASNNHDHIMVSLALFRSDNWRSFRLLENVDMDDVEMYEDKPSEVDRTEFSFVSINQPSWGL